MKAAALGTPLTALPQAIWSFWREVGGGLYTYEIPPLPSLFKHSSEFQTS
jgi:hypothetical protein